MAAPQYLVSPKKAPPLQIPRSSSTVTVRIIDSTSKLGANISMVAEPEIPGFNRFQAPAYSFLIEHSSGRKVLFDLGTRKDPEGFSPLVQGLLEKYELTIEVEKGVAQILEGHSISVSKGAIEAIIWSHWHYDHTGDPSTFPGSTTLIVGPGFKEVFLPGYPTGEKSPILESDYGGRELREIEFDDSLGRLGGLRYLDYFGDGSFYLLDAPGHAVGHLCGLARVTSSGGASEQDTFIFMGADACHHGGEFRPTEYVPLPRELKPSPYPRWASVCPGEWLQNLQYEKRADKPFYNIRPGFSHNDDETNRTIQRVSEIDAADNVLVIIAHDPALLEEGFPMFPAAANEWKRDNFAQKLHWCFLRDFEHAVKEINGS